MWSTPVPTRVYRNHHLDSSLWEGYVPRDDDIVVLSSYKSGTTWMRGILTALLKGAAADLDIGINVDGTGTNNVSLLDTTGATLNATLDQVRIGKQNSGGGSGNGTLTFDAGTITANSISLAEGNRSWATIRQLGGTLTVNGNVTDGTGSSQLRIEGGTFNAGGNVSADLIVVGYDARNATMNMTGATAAIGSASEAIASR